MIGFYNNDVAVLRCPTCGDRLRWSGRERDGVLANGVLECVDRHIWRVKDGVPNLADLSQLSQKDQLMDVVYDFLAPVHDLSVSYLLPVLQYPDEKSSRDNFIKAMKLKRKDMRGQGKRILEVGVGTGANLPLIRHRARHVLDMQIWAVDLNANMIAECVETNEQLDGTRLRLARADAHRLPFADSTFDRVIHVGGINIYRDARLGLAEMARVAKPHTPIVVVDEGLDQERENNVLHKLAFRWLTSLDEIREVPTDLLPEGCRVSKVFNPSRFYYCLVFEKTDEGALAEGMRVRNYGS